MESRENFEAAKNLNLEKLSPEEEFAKEYSKSLEKQESDLDFSADIKDPLDLLTRKNSGEFDKIGGKTKAEKIKENLSNLKDIEWLAKEKKIFKRYYPETIDNLSKIANEEGFENLFVITDPIVRDKNFASKVHCIHVFSEKYENSVFFPYESLENQQLLEKIDKDFADKGLRIVMRHEKEHSKLFAKNYTADNKFFGKEERNKLSRKEVDTIREKDEYADNTLEELTRFGESQTNLQAMVNNSDLESEEFVGTPEEIKDKRIKKVIDDFATMNVYIQSIYQGVDSLRSKVDLDSPDSMHADFKLTLLNFQWLETNFGILKQEIIEKIFVRAKKISNELLEKYDRFLDEQDQKK